MRLNKFIAEAGIASRRKADELIDEGRVSVNGILAVKGTSVSDDDRIFVDGKEIKRKIEKTYIAFNKPKGIICTEDKREPNNIIDFIGYPTRITYAGRLDKDSEGLILLTDDGDLIEALMKGRNAHEKEYVVSVDKKIDENFFRQMSEGVHIVDKEKQIDEVTRKAKLQMIDDFTFSIIITQGINRQIRRMCNALGRNVINLKRVRIMNIKLGYLEIGKYRKLTEEEISLLRENLNL
ncbi:MAG: pseudouridine synthase [Lachnospiraceae bacterium]|jgi:23S rRNA pseudouridine2604 synthase|nr:pseudouridine synthase [Lachnospiraceae bacterium]